MTKCQNKNCHDGATHHQFCLVHYRMHWRDRWDPKNGEEAMMNFLFECFPEHFNIAFGKPEWMVKAVHIIFDGFTNGKGVYSNLSALFMCRGFGKTSFIKGCACYCAAWKLMDFVQYRGVTITDAQENFLDGFQSMIISPMFVTIFGELLPANSRKHIGAKNQSKTKVLTNGFKVRVKGADQSSRGSLSAKKKIGWSIGDDIESISNSKTSESREELVRKIMQEDLPACDVNKGMLTYISTPHPDGIYFSIRSNPGFKKVEYWLYKKNEDETWLLDENGLRVPQWPEQFNYELCLQIEMTICGDPKKGRAIFNQEYLGILASDVDRQIKEEWIRYRVIESRYEFGRNWGRITWQDGKEHGGQYEPLDRVLAIDPATSKKAVACKTAGILVDTMGDNSRTFYELIYGNYQHRDVLNTHKHVGYYDIELNLDNISEPGIVGEVFRKVIQYKPRAVVLENIGDYEDIVRDIEDIKREWYSARYPDHTFQIIRYTPKGSDDVKINRIVSALKNLFETGFGFLAGRVREVTNDNGKVVSRVYPCLNLRDGLINLGISKELDLPDAAHFGRIMSRLPTKESYPDLRFRDRYGSQEKIYSTDIVSEYHEAFP